MIRASPRSRHGQLRAAVFDLEALEARQLLAVLNPTADEQYMLELLNRFRAQPQAELALLTSSLSTPARSGDGPTDSALRFFNTSGPTLAAQFSNLAPVPPLAWNANLIAAAEGHNNQMIAFDEQSHQLPGEPGLGDRATNAGYTNWATLGENVYAFARSVFHGHTGFVLDWGDTDTGIQQPPGHRDSMLSASYREVGIRITNTGTSPSRQTGPLVISQEFGRRFTQGNPYLLGVVYGDTTSDGYSSGEGFGGVTISIASEIVPAQAQFTTTSLDAGGWQIQVPPGQYSISFSGAGFGQSVTYRNVLVGSSNVKLDAKKGVRPPEPDIQVIANNVRIASGDTAPNLYDSTNFGPVAFGQATVTRTFIVANAGTRDLRLTGGLGGVGATNIRISGPAAADFLLVTDAVSTVAPSSSTGFSIRFEPRASGLRQATVTIVSTDPDTPGYTFAISGRGSVRPVVGVTGKGVPIAHGDAVPANADGTTFGPTDALWGVSEREYRVVNTGLSNLILSGAAPVQILDNPGGGYRILQQPSGVVPPGGSVAFRVRFTPGDTGLLVARVQIRTSDPMTPAYVFTVQGRGVAVPRAVISGAGQDIARDDATPELVDRTDFGRRMANVNDRLRLFTITNLGLGTLSFNRLAGVRITGVNASDFTIVSPPARGAIGYLESVTILVRFAPTGVGLRGAELSLVSNDPLGSYRFAVGGLAI